MKCTKFSLSYLKTMRLYYGFVTFISGWVGVAFYQFLYPRTVDVWRLVVISVFLFLSWGLNQVVNDYLGLREDRINAPNRPMVTGALPVGSALGLTGVLFAVFTGVSYAISPLSVIPALVGSVMNVVYQYLKGFGLWGNFAFGIAIANCPIYGFLASGSGDVAFAFGGFSTSDAAVAAVLVISVVAINGLMTFYTFFKDFSGDKSAGLVTLVVRYGPDASRCFGFFGVLVLVLIALASLLFGCIPIPNQGFAVATLVLCSAVALVLQVRTAFLYFTNPRGEATYHNLKENIRACNASHATLIAVFDGRLALFLLVTSYALVGIMFDSRGVKS